MNKSHDTSLHPIANRLQKQGHFHFVNGHILCLLNVYSGITHIDTLMTSAGLIFPIYGFANIRLDHKSFGSHPGFASTSLLTRPHSQYPPKPSEEKGRLVTTRH